MSRIIAFVKPALKIAVSLGLLAWLLCLVDWRQVLALAPRANPGLMLLAVALLTLERVVSVAKWLLLLRARETSVSFGRLFIINYVGGFWGLVLPSSVSADIVRGYYLARTAAGLGNTVSSMLADRILSGLALVCLAGAGAWLAGDRFGLVHHRAAMLGLLALAAAAAALLFRPEFLRRLDAGCRRLAPRRLERQLGRLRDWAASCLEYRRQPARLALAFALSLLMQGLRVLVFYATAAGFGVQAPLAYYFLFIPLITVLIMLPFSFGGIGIREGSFVAFFAVVGVPAADAFTVSFAVSILTTLTSAVGGLIYLCDRGVPAGPAPEIRDTRSEKPLP